MDKMLNKLIFYTSLMMIADDLIYSIKIEESAKIELAKQNRNEILSPLMIQDISSL
jgi:hypothetical protein